MYQRDSEGGRGCCDVFRTRGPPGAISGRSPYGSGELVRGHGSWKGSSKVGVCFGE